MKRTALVAGAAVLALAIATSSAAAATSLRTHHPKWFTHALKVKINKAGKRGVSVRQAAGPGTTDVCPGVDPNSPTPSTSVVSAGTCEVFPYGCTANFVY